MIKTICKNFVFVLIILTFNNTLSAFEANHNNSKLSEKTILVTGGAGFLGSHLCKRLLEKNNKVLCIDNFYTGSKDNISELLNHPNFILLEHDIINPILLDENIDEIYNLACPASPIHYQKDPIQTLKTSVLGALSVLELAKKNHAKILQASTSEIYGDPLEHPQTEKYFGNVNTTGIRACYDEGKRCAETLFFDCHRRYNVSIKVARIFNTYGPKMSSDDGRVVSNFITQALRNEPITIYSDGSQTRSFCYVDDLIEALLLLMQTDDDFIGPINLGNTDEFTILALAQKVIFLTKSDSEIVFYNMPEDDPKLRKPDISLAMDKLHWQPNVYLDQGLVKTIEYFHSK